MTQVRTDLVDVYVFRRGAGAVEFLQLRRVGEPLSGTWHPLMGHLEPSEAPAACARRELAEEVGLSPGDPALMGLWALQGVHPYYLPTRDAVMLTPRFAAEVRPGWSPRLNEEHDAHRWVREPGAFLWPGQRAAVAEILEVVVPGGPAPDAMRV